MLFRYRRRRKAMFGFLIIAIVMTSVGFSAFSSELSISSSAIVVPEASAFRIVLSSSNDEELTEMIAGIGVEGATGGHASIDNTGSTPSISGLTANFTEPGQSVSYKFYIHNSGAYLAYLNSVTFGIVEGSDALPKVCTAIDSSNTTESLLEAACNSINVSVVIGDTNVNGSATDITNNTIEKGAYKEAIVTISYASGNNVSDGDFNVEFGDISLAFSSQD